MEGLDLWRAEFQSIFVYLEQVFRGCHCNFLAIGYKFEAVIELLAGPVSCLDDLIDIINHSDLHHFGCGKV